MTANKTVFINWFKRHHPDKYIRSLPNTPVVEIETIPTGKANKGHLDLNYITCEIGSVVPVAGIQYDGLENRHIFVFIGTTIQDAANFMKQPIVEPKPKPSRAGQSVFMPTSINAFNAWCDRHGIYPTTKQRIPNINPKAVYDLTAPEGAYYYTEFTKEDLNKLPLVLSNVPHKEVDDKHIMVLIKATGGNKKMGLLEKALKHAILFRTKEAVRYYAEVFLQKRISLDEIALDKINWGAPNVGVEIIGSIKIPSGTSNDISYDF